MDLQGSSAPYSFVALEKELEVIQPYSIKSFVSKLKEHLKANGIEAVKLTAKELLDEIDKKNQALSKEGRSFLGQLITVGSLQETYTEDDPETMAANRNALCQVSDSYTYTEFENDLRILLDRHHTSDLQDKFQAVQTAYEQCSQQKRSTEEVRQKAKELHKHLTEKKLTVPANCEIYLQFLEDKFSYDEKTAATDSEPQGKETVLAKGRNKGSQVTQIHVNVKPPSSKSQSPQSPQPQAAAVKGHSTSTDDIGHGGDGLSKTQIIKPKDGDQAVMFASQGLGSAQRIPLDVEPKASLTFLHNLKKSITSNMLDLPTFIKVAQPKPGVEEDIVKQLYELKEDQQKQTKAKTKEIERLQEQLDTAKHNMKMQEKESEEKENLLRNRYENEITARTKAYELDMSKLLKQRKADAEEIEGWKNQLEESNKREFGLHEANKKLHSENTQLKSRVSELAGAKLMDNNPDIADLSDPNRALKLGERFSSLYDDDWTDAFQTYTDKFNMKEDEAIHFLLNVLLKTYDFCRKVADEQMDCLCNVFENPCQDIPKALTMKPQKEKTQITQKQFKDLKDLRKQIGLRKAGSITKQYVSKEYEEVKKGDKKLKSMLDETKCYYEKCVEVCWPMVLHDPPVRMEYHIKPGIKIDGNRFRLYGGNGDVLEYLVWPPLLVEGGGLLAKGVAKPKKTPRTIKKP